MSPIRKAPRVRVRMYHVGFGDCFLLTLPTAAGPRHVLFDCGVHPKGDAKTMKDIVADIATTTGRKLAVVVATHEHADHISGFGAFADEFAAFEIAELWMPWAMDLSDPLAVSLRRKRLKLAEQLADHFAALGARQPAAVQEVLLNLTSNERAMAALRSGFSGAARKTRYLRAGDAADVGTLLPGTSVRVLGPPIDETFLKRMDPPASQRYLKVAGSATQVINGISPFGKRDRFDDLREGRRAYGFSRAGTRDISEASLRESALESAEALAFTLDSVANNTSLVLLVTHSGRDMLFPGDAQWGSWQSWLEGPGAPALDNISFLKVSHHGSVNATPKKALEAMTHPRLAAMVSTQNVPFPSIPHQRLLDAFHGRVARSDRTAKRPFKSGKLWTDCTSL